jgi:hypothetical protein
MENLDDLIIIKDLTIICIDNRGSDTITIGKVYYNAELIINTHYGIEVYKIINDDDNLDAYSTPMFKPFYRYKNLEKLLT